MKIKISVLRNNFIDLNLSLSPIQSSHFTCKAFSQFLIQNSAHLLINTQCKHNSNSTNLQCSTTLSRNAHPNCTVLNGRSSPPPEGTGGVHLMALLGVIMDDVDVSASGI